MSTKYRIPDNQISMFDTGLIKDRTPSMPIFDKSRCEARLINYETAARMVETYHYAHRVPSIVVAVGMFVDDILSGVCTYNTVFSNIGKSVCGEEYGNSVLELSRLYIHDWAGRNSESWLISQSFKFVIKSRPHSFILLSYADNEQNHLGTIYQATNWLYTGLSSGARGREYVINGKIKTRRDFDFRRNSNSNEIMSFSELQSIYPNIEKVESSDKHRYVYFLGSKSQRKKLRKALKWLVLPYPKSEG